MLKQYRFTIWYMALSDGALQFLSPMIVDALDEAEAMRTGYTLAGMMLSAGFAAKVMVRIEGDGVDRSIELPN